jgi:large subunit ribosomal protein L9
LALSRLRHAERVSTVKVVFLETVEGSGAMGEVKDVARGYARNYLLPRGFAAPATPTLLRRAEELARIEEERQRDQDEHAHELVGRLDEVTLVMTARVGEQGRLYGSVTSADIAEKAGEILGEELDRRRVLLPEVIRSVGLYTVPLRLSRNVIPEVQVAVVDAEAPEGVEAAVQTLLAPPEEEEPTAEDVTTAEASTVDGSSDSGAEGVPESGDTTSDEPASDATEATSDASEAATEEAETPS